MDKLQAKREIKYLEYNLEELNEKLNSLETNETLKKEIILAIETTKRKILIYEMYINNNAMTEVILDKILTFNNRHGSTYTLQIEDGYYNLYEIGNYRLKTLDALKENEKFEYLKTHLFISFDTYHNINFYKNTQINAFLLKDLLEIDFLIRSAMAEAFAPFEEELDNITKEQ
jgi:uncharacterized membrane protein YheB (UPF0754 family)